MSKRKRDEMESLDHIKKKIKKLERKLLKGQRRRKISSSSDSVQLSTEPQDDVINESEYVEMSIEDLHEAGPSTSEPRAAASGQLPDIPDTLETSPPPGTDCVPGIEDGPQIQELDEMMLEILGSDPSTTATFGKEIQKDLAIRFNYIATAGVTKELRKELMEAHLPPANCKLIDAPSLNAEIKAAVTELVVKRDKAIQTKQKQMGSAIACLSEAITILLSKDTKDPTILKLLTDAGRLLCDCQHNESVTRRNFILAVLKKELKDQMQLTKIDSLLFGQELADTLRTAKAINKSGADLKAAAQTKNFANKPKPQPTYKNLNWKAPAPTRRQPGPPRAKEPAPPRQQHANSSRTSRPTTTRGRPRR